MDIPQLWAYSAVGAVAALLVWSAFRPPWSRQRFVLHALIGFIALLLAAMFLPDLEPWPNRIRASCVANLKQIERAKAEWAREFNKTATDVPRDSDLFGEGKYIRERPTCPEGGTYQLWTVGIGATCNLIGWQHQLNGRPLRYQGNVTLQKAFFVLCGIGWVAVIRLLWGVWQVKRPRQKLILAGLAGILVVLTFLPLPIFVPARAASSRNACTANLWMIQGAKETWALENKKSPTDVPSPADLIGSDKSILAAPVCPDGGSYRLGAVGEKATCSVSGPGHTLDSSR